VEREGRKGSSRKYCLCIGLRDLRDVPCSEGTVILCFNNNLMNNKIKN